jgi:hypothetical protein
VPGSPPSWTAARRRTRHGWRPNSRGAGPRQACRQPRPEAHRSLGTAEAVTGLYRAEAEEESLIQDLLRGRSVDESLDTRRSGTDGEDAGLDDFLADFFRPVGEEAHRRTLWRPVAALPPWSRRAAEPPARARSKDTGYAGTVAADPVWEPYGPDARQRARDWAGTEAEGGASQPLFGHTARRRVARAADSTVQAPHPSQFLGEVPVAAPEPMSPTPRTRPRSARRPPASRRGADRREPEGSGARAGRRGSALNAPSPASIVGHTDSRRKSRRIHRRRTQKERPPCRSRP